MAKKASDKIMAGLSEALQHARESPQLKSAMTRRLLRNGTAAGPVTREMMAVCKQYVRNANRLAGRPLNEGIDTWPDFLPLARERQRGDPMTPEARAELMWRVHPRELQDAGKTRRQFYADHVRSAERDATKRVGRALVRTAASLAAAISLLERTPRAKKAAASDKMFDQMILDYKASLESARGALRETDRG